MNEEKDADKLISSRAEIMYNQIHCAEALIDASGKVEAGRVKDLLNNGCDPNSLISLNNGWYDSAMRVAVDKANKEIVEILLNYGANPNLDLGNNLNPFHYAVAYAPIEIIKLLYYAGGDIDKYNEYKIEHYNPLFSSIIKKRYDVVEFLLEEGCSVKAAKDSMNRRSALRMAAHSLDTNIVNLLLRYGAKINNRFNQFECDDCLFGAPGETALFDAISIWVDLTLTDERYNMVKHLLRKGAEVNLVNDYGMSPLDYAVRTKDKRLVKLLISHGAPIESEGRSALNEAARRASPSITEYLIEQGGNPNYKDKYGRNSLWSIIYCCSDGFGEGIRKNDMIKTIDLLIEAGADLGGPNERGELIEKHCESSAHVACTYISRTYFKN